MRILDPSIFGVFMKVLAIVGVIEILIGLRLGGGIVQQKNVDSNQLGTVFWLNGLWTIILGIIFYFSGSVVAGFYDDNRVINLMQWASLVVIITGIGYVPRSILTKTLNYKSIFISNLIAVILSSALGLYMAHNNYSYWSLFWLWASFNIVLSIAYFFFSKFKPGLSIDIKCIQGMWYFSKSLLVNDLLNYTARNIDNIIVGKVLGSNALGIYSRAYNIMLLPIQNFVSVINGVLFPSFSIIQDDKERVKQIFSKAVSSILLLTIPFMMFGWLFANEITLIIFGEKWSELGQLLQIFLILGMVQVQTSFAGSVFMSLGRSDLPLKVSYLSKPILILVIFILVNYGISTLAIGITLVSSIFSLIQLGLALRLLNYNGSTFIYNVSPVWLLNMGLTSVFFLAKVYLFASIGGIQLTILFMVLVFVNIIVYERYKPEFYRELKHIIRDQISRK